MFGRLLRLRSGRVELLKELRNYFVVLSILEFSSLFWLARSSVGRQTDQKGLHRNVARSTSKTPALVSLSGHFPLFPANVKQIHSFKNRKSSSSSLSCHTFAQIHFIADWNILITMVGVSYHELTSGSQKTQRHTAGERKQFLVICVVGFAFFFNAFVNAGIFEAVDIKNDGIYPGGEYIHKLIEHKWVILI